MAKNTVPDWDENDNLNTDIGGTNIDEGCPPSGMNNAVRKVMSQLKAYFKASVFRIWDGTDTTKQLAFALSGLTTATTRTLTVQDKNGTIALTSDIGSSNNPGNFALGVPTVSAGALTIPIKGFDGNDPSVSNAVTIPFRSATAGSGDIDVLTLTAATSLVISSGSTLGAPTANVPFTVWLVGFNDAGTFRLAAILATTLASGALVQYPLGAWGIASSTAEGGAGAADSAQTFYTGAAVTAKPYTVLGCLHFETGLATAGTWTAPTRVQVFDASVPLPGQSVQKVSTTTGAVATGSTLIPGDDTIPQSTEGDQYFTQTVTPSSASNLLLVECSATYSHTQANASIILAIFQDATANSLSVGFTNPGVATLADCVPVTYMGIAATVSATTFKVRAGSPSAGTLTLNGASSARLFGGVIGSYLRITEIAS